MFRSILLFGADATPKPNNCNGEDCAVNLPSVSANSGQLESGLSVIFGVFAAVATIVIIVAAINFANSEGDPEKIKKAKRSIIFALVGLVIALSAEAAVLTVLNRL